MDIIDMLIFIIKLIMKNINFKIYLIALFVSLLWIISFSIVNWWTKNFWIVMIWIIFSIWLVNIGSILFYKTLNINNDILKYSFSCVHIISIVFITLFL